MRPDIIFKVLSVIFFQWTVLTTIITNHPQYAALLSGTPPYEIIQALPWPVGPPPADSNIERLGRFLIAAAQRDQNKRML